MIFGYLFGEWVKIRGALSLKFIYELLLDKQIATWEGERGIFPTRIKEIKEKSPMNWGRVSKISLDGTEVIDNETLSSDLKMKFAAGFCSAVLSRSG
jgi:hypothetical protein